VYKVFAKIFHSRLLLYAIAVVQHQEVGFQSGSSATAQLFTLRQILEKTTNLTSLRIDIKATNDTITRYEMAELYFPTKLIRLPKATLITVKCCVKLQNDCLDSFETRQRLRQRDVLSTLVFNNVLKRRGKLQTTGTVINKQTKLLAYADDIDIVGRNLEAVRDA
jgi:hypothetical protein